MSSAILATVSRQRLAGIMDIVRDYPIAVFPTMEGSKLLEIKRASDNKLEAEPIPVYLYETG